VHQSRGRQLSATNNQFSVVCESWRKPGIAQGGQRTSQRSSLGFVHLREALEMSKNTVVPSGSISTFDRIKSSTGNLPPDNQRDNATNATSPEVRNVSLAVHASNSASSSERQVDSPIASATGDLIVEREPFPYNLPRKLDIALGQSGKAFSVRSDAGNRYVLHVGSKQLNNIIRKLARAEGVTLRQSDIGEINNILQAHAETACINRDVWYRVAPYVGGVELDLGDDKHTRVRITSGKVEVMAQGSETLFYRTPVSRAFVMPAAVGNLDLLKKYLNLHPVSIMLLIGWITYTLAHPKVPSSKFVILVLQGNQGTGKSSLCTNVIQKLIDPNRVGVRILPNNGKDFAIAAQNAHVLCYDNVREFKPSMADLLCIAATGGSLSTRQLYTDADQQIIELHVALVMNGVHSFIEQPDFAQRCLPIQLLPLAEANRKSEAQLVREFEADSPAILRGLFDLIAEVILHLPTAEVTNPERMIDFVQWIAAMEKAKGIPPGIYQAAYSDALNQGQLDSLLENLLAAAIVEFADDIKTSWSGTPSELLIKLNLRATKGAQRSRDWPQNSIALSKRLIPLQAGLLTQGIRVELSRGKQRAITICKAESEK